MKLSNFYWAVFRVGLYGDYTDLSNVELPPEVPNDAYFYSEQVRKDGTMVLLDAPRENMSSPPLYRDPVKVIEGWVVRIDDEGLTSTLHPDSRYTDFDDTLWMPAFGQRMLRWQKV